MGTVQLADDGTIFIACGSTLTRLNTATISVQCGVEELQSKDECVKEDTTEPTQQDKKQAKKQANAAKEAALFGSPHIVGLALSCTKCVVVSSNKVLEVRDAATLHRVAAAQVPKRPTAVKLTKDEIVVSDKSGDVYLYNIDLSVRRYLLGHVSMVLSLALSPCNHYLVSCDRDEKIRVSNFPNCYNIHGYCLGHTEYVSTVCYITDTLLVSIAGDKSMKLWDTSTGHCLHTIPNTPYTNLNYNGEHVYTTHTTDNNTVLSVYQLSNNTLTKLSEMQFDTKIVSFSVNKSKCLILTNEPKVIIVPIKSGHILRDSQKVIEGLELKGLVNEQITVKKTVAVSERTNDYFDRKRRRIEEEEKAAKEKGISV